MFQNRKRYYSFWDRKDWKFCVCRVKDSCYIDQMGLVHTDYPDPRLDEILEIKINGFPYVDGMINRYQLLGRISHEEFKRLRANGVRRL